MRTIFMVALATAAMSSICHGQIFSNRSVDPRLAALNAQTVTYSGAAAPVGGFWSEVQHDTGNLTVANNIVGSSIHRTGTTGAFRVADDFDVVNGSALVTKVRIFAYQVNTGVTTPIASSISLNIWEGRPGDVGSTVVSNNPSAAFIENSSFPVQASGTTITSGNIYRIFDTVAPAPGIAPTTNRVVHEFVVTLGAPIVLPSGNYWIDAQVTTINGNSAFTPLTTHQGFRAPQNPNMVGNARQFTTSGWTDIIDLAVPSSGSDINMEVPFQVDGTCTLYPVSYSILQGSPFGGNLGSLFNSDNDRIFVFCDEFAPNSEVEMTFDTMTSYSGATYVGNLTFNVETRSSRNDQIEFLKARDWVAGTDVTLSNWISTFADTPHSVTVVGAASYVNNSHLIRMKLLVIPTTDIDSGDGWLNAIDMSNIVCG